MRLVSPDLHAFASILDDFQQLISYDASRLELLLGRVAVTPYTEVITVTLEVPRDGWGRLFLCCGISPFSELVHIHARKGRFNFLWSSGTIQSRHWMEELKAPDRVGKQSHGREKEIVPQPRFFH